MILPPFYGGVASQATRDRTWYNIRNSYLGQDVLYFKIPSKNILQTYLAVDALMYIMPPVGFGSARVSYLNIDTLFFTIPENKSINSYLNFDALYYNPPPEAPDMPLNVYGTAGDGNADLTWTKPYDNRSPITDYHIQYSTSGLAGFGSWENFDDPVSTGTSVYIDQLVNGVNYKFRVAAINSIGTGDYGISNVVSPSPGDQTYCKMLSYLPFDTDFLDQSCISGTVSGIYQNSNSLEISSNEYKYGGASLFLDGQPYSVPSPYYEEYYYEEYVNEYPHLEIGFNQNINWNFSGDFTIEMFIKPSSSTGYGTLLTIRDLMPSWYQDYPNNNYIKLYRNNNSIKFDWNLDFYDLINDEYIYNNQTITANNVNLPTNDWTHLSVIRYNNTIKLYVNGIASGNAITSNVLMNLSGFPIFVGSDIGDIYYQGTRSSDGFGGYIDQLIISRTARYKNNFTPSQYNLLKECNC